MLAELLELPSPPQTQVRAQRSAFLDGLPRAPAPTRPHPSFRELRLATLTQPELDDAHHIGLNQYCVANARPNNFSCLFAAILLAERAYATKEPDFRRWDYQSCIEESARLYQAYTTAAPRLPTFEEALHVMTRECPEKLQLFTREYLDHSDYAESNWSLAAKLYTWLDKLTSSPTPCIVVLICGLAAHCLTVRPAHGAAHRTIYLLDTHGDWQSPRHARQNYYTSGKSAESIARYLTHAKRVPAQSQTFEAWAFFVPAEPTSRGETAG